MAMLIGTSGWQYDSWREPYYRGTPQRRWYERILTDFRTVELNVSFYRLPKREVFAGWRTRAPLDAIVTVKASRYLTHVKRLRDAKPSVQMLMERASALGPVLGPVLVQLPPDMRAEPELLAETLDAFPPGVRLAVEPRHASWWNDDVRDVLTARNAALVWADRGNEAMAPLWRTADWGYHRFHGGSPMPFPSYSRAALQTWAERIATTYADDEDVFVYFNNDPGCAAIDDAITFAEVVDELGRTRSRVPRERPVIDLAALEERAAEQRAAEQRAAQERSAQERAGATSDA